MREGKLLGGLVAEKDSATTGVQADKWSVTQGNTLPWAGKQRCAGLI